MRKLFSALLLLLLFSPAFAQKLDDVKEKISKNKYDEAKEKIDKVFEDPKNASNAEAWYWKGKTYAGLAQQDSTHQLTYDALGVAFESYKKYQELDKQNKFMAIRENEDLFLLYDISYTQGGKAYNDKNYDVAYKKMKSALEVQTYITSKGFSYRNFTFPTMDTSLINLTASSAYLAKKEAESIPYFERLADANLGGPAYKEIYGLLAEFHLKNGNTAKADKYIAAGRKLYPTESPYWNYVEFGTIADTAARMKRYDELLAKDPTNYDYAIDQATEMYNYTYSNDVRPADYKARQEKLTTYLKRAIGINSTPFANFIMGQHIYQQIYDIDDAARLVRGTTPADVAKRKAFNVEQGKKYDELYPYLMASYNGYKAQTELKAMDKANLRKVLGQLVDYHSLKKQADKAAQFKTEADAMRN